MNKNELVSAVAEQSGVSKKDVEKVIKAMTSAIHEELANGGKVQIPDLGAFKCNDRKERTVRNPKTGETMVSPACKVAKFTAAKALKECVNK
ncbi:MAG: HU family DNA-binding protein [Eubacteriales bacterium]|nr:HU family DNA-binding protein [Eubacteriales bacterium]